MKKREQRAMKHESGAVAVMEADATASVTPEIPKSESRIIPRSKIEVRAQVRKSFDRLKLEELASNILAMGILQPLVVRPLPKYELQEPDLADKTWRIVSGSEVVHQWEDDTFGRESAQMLFKELSQYEYHLVAGERRFRASEIAGLTELPCVVRPMTDQQMLEIQLVENDQREDLNGMERAEGYERMRTELGYSIAQICERTGKRRSTVYDVLALIKASQPVRDAIGAGLIDDTIGRLISKIPGEKSQKEALKAIVDRSMSHREAKEFIATNFALDLGSAKFDPKAEDLFPAGVEPTSGIVAGPCAMCEFRSGTDPARFPEIGSPNVCTNTTCYKAKTVAHLERKLETYKKQGLEVLPPSETSRIFCRWNDQLNYGCGFVRATDVCDFDDKQRTFEKILRAKLPTPVVVLDLKDEPVKVYREEEVTAALGKAGIKDPDEVEPVKETQEQKDKRERENALKEELAELKMVAVVEAIEKKGLKNEKEATTLLRVLVRQMQSSVDYDYDMCDRRGFAPNEDHGERFCQGIAKMNAGELLGVAFEMLCNDYGGYNEELLSEGMGLMGVNVAKLKDQVDKGEVGAGLGLQEIWERHYRVNHHGIVVNPARFVVDMKKSKCKAVIEIGFGGKAWHSGCDASGIDEGLGVPCKNKRNEFPTPQAAIKDAVSEMLTLFAGEKYTAERAAVLQYENKTIAALDAEEKKIGKPGMKKLMVLKEVAK